VLLLGATAPLAACTLFDDGSTAAPTPAPPHPDDLLRDRVVAAEHELIAWYEATAREHPEVAEALGPFRARHERHVDAVAATARVHTPEATATPTTPRPDPSPPSIITAVPVDPAAAVDRLTEFEAAAVEARLADCLAARDGRLATLFASIAACEASHDRLLRAVVP
jgi:hypothetical protein